MKSINGNKISKKNIKGKTSKQTLIRIAQINSCKCGDELLKITEVDAENKKKFKKKKQTNLKRRS